MVVHVVSAANASSTQVPLWVPIVVGVLGFIGVISAQVIAGWREDRRWRREQEREELRWRREREREHESRSYDSRAAGYAEVIGAVEAFDSVLFQARRAAGLDAALVEADAALDEELRAVFRAARNALGAVNLHAPERVRVMLREVMLPRFRLATHLLDGTGEQARRSLWDDGQLAYRRIRAAMREDLGLDAEPLPESG
jgi:hypothetical protein